MEFCLRKPIWSISHGPSQHFWIRPTSELESRSCPVKLLELGINTPRSPKLFRPGLTSVLFNRTFRKTAQRGHSPPLLPAPANQTSAKLVLPDPPSHLFSQSRPGILFAILLLLLQLVAIRARLADPFLQSIASPSFDRFLNDESLRQPSYCSYSHSVASRTSFFFPTEYPHSLVCSRSQYLRAH